MKGEKTFLGTQNEKMEMAWNNQKGERWNRGAREQENERERERAYVMTSTTSKSYFLYDSCGYLGFSAKFAIPYYDLLLGIAAVLRIGLGSWSLFFPNALDMHLFEWMNVKERMFPNQTESNRQKQRSKAEYGCVLRTAYSMAHSYS